MGKRKMGLQALHRKLNYIMKKVILFLLLLVNASLVFGQDNCFFFKTTILKEHRFDETDDEGFYGFPFLTTLSFEGDDSLSIISKNAKNYLSCFKAYILDPVANMRSKHYAVMSMQKLDPAEYLELLEVTYKAYKNQLVHSETLKLAINQGFFWSNTVLLNVHKPKYKVFFDKILKEKCIKKSTRELIKKMIDKKGNQQFRKIYKENRIYCC